MDGSGSGRGLPTVSRCAFIMLIYQCVRAGPLTPINGEWIAAHHTSSPVYLMASESLLAASPRRRLVQSHQNNINSYHLWPGHITEALIHMSRLPERYWLSNQCADCYGRGYYSKWNALAGFTTSFWLGKILILYSSQIAIKSLHSQTISRVYKDDNSNSGEVSPDHLSSPMPLCVYIFLSLAVCVCLCVCLDINKEHGLKIHQRNDGGCISWKQVIEKERKKKAGEKERKSRRCRGGGNCVCSASGWLNRWHSCLS